ncbi:hypothetical protein AHAS_Ahas13G0293300 [Arachis hypogaea]
MISPKDKDKITNLSYLERSAHTTINTLEHPDTTAPTTTADLDRDRPTVSGNPRNIGVVARDPRSHPVTMADNLVNDHNFEDKLLKLEADLKTRNTHSNHEDNSHKDQDPFSKEIMKAKVPKEFKAPDMTSYNDTSDPSHHISNFRSRMYLAVI